ncbi:MAG: polysaccharide pyruvyl transferase family protein [Cocleimonas sp.]|nr:polysaccharide pyruvyl transferase family protein [Cocleimonas sp.]
MARVGYMADNFGEFSASMKVTADNIMWKSGSNIGNFAFWNAAQLLFDEEVVLFPYGSKSDNYIGKLDFIVIPAANWLSVGQDFTWLATFIEEVDVPCLIFGLGAQSESLKSFPKLENGTLELLKALSKRTPYLAVRGDYTKNLCKSLGINNVEALGCPSILTSSNQKLGEVVASKWVRSADKIAVHGLNLKPNIQFVEQYLFNLMTDIKGSSYIIQEPRSFIRLMTQEGLIEEDNKSLQKAYEYLVLKNSLKTAVEGIRNYLLGSDNSNASYEVFIRNLREYSYVPFSLNSWSNYLSYHSHAVGTRIHGSIISLTAEIPSICIPHDTRTTELCNIMKIPTLSIMGKNIMPDSVESLFSEVAFCGEEFDENRRYLAAKNADMIQQAGLKVSSHLKQFL